MVYLWEQGSGVYDIALPDVPTMVAHLRNLGGDRSKWVVMLQCNQGMVNVPILGEWFV